MTYSEERIKRTFIPNTICSYCGCAYYKRPAHKRRQKNQECNYCSLKCRGLSQRKENNPSWAGGKTYKRCEVCGKEFGVYGNRRKTARFCSMKCRNIAFSGTRNHRFNQREYICGFCGKLFMGRGGLEGDGMNHYCSGLCADSAQSKRMMAEGNTNWRGGIGNSPWSYEFGRKLKKHIKSRDRYSCRYCGKQNCVLHIHHIDYNKKNNEYNNLISLCENCHGKTGYKRKYWKKRLSNLLNV